MEFKQWYRNTLHLQNESHLERFWFPILSLVEVKLCSCLLCTQMSSLRINGNVFAQVKSQSKNTDTKVKREISNRQLVNAENHIVKGGRGSYSYFFLDEITMISIQAVIKAHRCRFSIFRYIFLKLYLPLICSVVLHTNLRDVKCRETEYAILDSYSISPGNQTH